MKIVLETTDSVNKNFVGNRWICHKNQFKKIIDKNLSQSDYDD